MQDGRNDGRRTNGLSVKQFQARKTTNSSNYENRQTALRKSDVKKKQRQAHFSSQSALLSRQLTDGYQKRCHVLCEHARPRAGGLDKNNPSPWGDAVIQTAMRIFAAVRRGSSCQTPLSGSGLSLSHHYRVFTDRFLAQRNIFPVVFLHHCISATGERRCRLQISSCYRI